MDSDEFHRMVERLERKSAASPMRYRANVAALALLGFLILALLLGALGFGLVALAGVAIVLAVSGGAALVLLLKLGKLLVFLAIPLWYMGKSAIKALLIRLPAPEGREITRQEAPALFAAIDAMRARMKGPRFHHVLVVDDVNAAIMQRPAFGLFGWPRNYLLLGLPLLECLPPEEALAVVAHEYGHLAGSHGQFSAFIYRLRHTWATVQVFTDHVQGWLGRLVAPVIRWYAPYFNAYTFVLARADEYQADAASAELVGAKQAAQALKRVNLVVPRHQRFMKETFERIDHDAAPPADVMHRWVASSALPPTDADARRWLGEALDRENEATDTHPTLRARLAALDAGAEALGEPPPPMSGPSAAQAWLGPIVDALRGEFQRAWADRVAEGWASLHADAQKARQRLAELRLMPQPDVDQQLERLRLTMRLEPDTEVREELAAFNAAHPNHAAGLFFEGAARLDRGEAAGLALLERAMSADADVTKPACERARAFLIEQRDPKGAEAYAVRWRARDVVESQRERELAAVDPKHAIASSGRDAQELAALRSLLAGARIPYLKAAYLGRRVIPSDPAFVRLSMGVKLTWIGRRLGKRDAVLTRLVQLEWPFPLEFIALEGRFAKLARRFEAVADAKVL